MEQIRNKRVTLKQETAQQSGKKMSKVLSGKVQKSELLNTKNGPRWIVKTENGQEAWGSTKDPVLTAVVVGQDVKLIEQKNGWQSLGNEAAAIAPATELNGSEVRPAAAVAPSRPFEGRSIEADAAFFRRCFDAVAAAFADAPLRSEELLPLVAELFKYQKS